MREANLISNELNRKVQFHSQLKGAIPDFADDSGRTEIKREFAIRVDNNEDGVGYVWNPDKFSNRVILMREKYNEYVDNLGKIPDFSDKNDDPWWDEPEPMEIGKCYLELASLAYAIDCEKEANLLTTESGRADGTAGKLQISYIPCTEDGNEDPDALPDGLAEIEEETEMLGKQLHFKVKVDFAKDLPIQKATNTYVEYRFKHEPEYTYRTDVIQGKNTDPKWSYEKIHQVDCINDYILDYFKTGKIVFKCFGNSDLKQAPTPAVHQGTKAAAAATSAAPAKPPAPASTSSGAAAASSKPAAAASPATATAQPTAAAEVPATTNGTVAVAVGEKQGSACCTIF